ncbi:MG2 domain-containing protein [Radicibacter daui]|uniref:MG2 domain-containing protein n=1 Tax=Radicibacter daui TaxID=3064829 RepID=UPI004046B193
MLRAASRPFAILALSMWALTGLPAAAATQPQSGEGQTIKPSFDCSGRLNPLETLICEDTDLARQDDELARLYGSLKESQPAAGWTQIAEAQKRWLSARNKDCALPEGELGNLTRRHQAETCLADAYRQRLAALTDFSTPGMSVVADPQVKSDQSVAEVCLDFDAPLDQAHKAGIGAFVTTEPAVKFGWRVERSSLCLDGFEHSTDYTLHLAAGLPGVGAVLKSPYEAKVSIGARPQRLRVASSGHVLPRSGDAAFPVETVNIDKVSVALLQLKPEDLIRYLGAHPLEEDGSYARFGRLAAQAGKLLWKGELMPAARKDQTVTTALPLAKAAGDLPPGAYLLALEPTPTDGADARFEGRPGSVFHWFTISDIGLSLYQGEGGLTVISRSAASTRPLSGIKFQLMARGGDVLTKVESGEDGLAHIGAGFLRGTKENTPGLLYAWGPEGDFTLFDLSDGLIELSDRGVSGRPAPGPLDAYVTSERGIYRPGETVHFTLLLRDGKAGDTGGLPVALSVRRPDDQQVWRLALKDEGGGSYTGEVTIPPSASPGTWAALAFVGDGKVSTGRVDFQVQDFQPPQIETKLDVASAAATPDAPLGLTIGADYLYGAPAAGLDGEVDSYIRVAAHRGPAKEDDGYQYGLVQETAPESVRQEVTSFTTGDDGKASLDLSLSEMPDTSYPLEAVITASVMEEGGRPVERRRIVAIANNAFDIGIRPLASASHLDDDAPARFDVVVKDAAGTPVVRSGLDWRLVREDVDYVWYDQGYRWRYKTVYYDRETVAQGTLDYDGQQPARIDAEFKGWGSFRLEVTDPATGLVSSTRFWGGWGEIAGADEDERPDKVDLTLAPGSVSAGGKARLHVTAPFTGVADLVVAGASVRSHLSVDVSPDGTDVELPMPADAVGGLYVLANAFAAPSQRPGYVPARAVGVLWVPLDDQANRLEVALAAPDSMEPGTRLETEISLSNLADGPAWVTLAAVDDGVLGLTGYKAPDPFAWYLGQRALGVSLSDNYSDFIDASRAEAGEFRSGGDGAGFTDSGQLSNLPRKGRPVVSLVSGVVEVKGGKAVVPFEVPEFDGRLRLMVMAWQKGAHFGHADRTLLVRRPLVADLAMPLFLAPGDKADLTLSMNNLQAPEGDYVATLSTSGAVLLQGAAEQHLTLAPGQHARAGFTVAAIAGVGEGEVTLAVTGPGGFSQTRHWPLDVRSGNGVESERYISELKPGETLALDPALLKRFYPSTLKVSLGANPLPDLGVPAILASLAAYPYGCSEQTTSTGFPLLMTESFKDYFTNGLHRPDPAGLQQALDRLATYQLGDGEFGQWSNDWSGSPWISVYVSDFLYQVNAAKPDGVKLPPGMLDRTANFLKRRAADEDTDDQSLSTAAYAQYVLARSGLADGARVRRFYLTNFDKLPDALSKAMVGAALAQTGNRTEAAKAMSAVLAGEQDLGGNYWQSFNYASALRDRAAILTLMAESGVVEWPQVIGTAKRLSADVQHERWLSTQEEAWVLRAARALRQAPAGQLKLAVGDQQQSLEAGKVYLASASGAEEAAKLPALRNAGDSTADGFISLSGVPAGIAPARQEGYSVHRSVYDRDGNALSPDALHQGDAVVVVIEGTLEAADRLAQTLIVDYLPAGLELENAALVQGDSDGEGEGRFGWLGELSSPDHLELRDDRYVAALELDSRPHWSDDAARFKLAYVARVVTPGSFSWAGSYVEDMFAPTRFGRDTPATMTATPKD